MAPETDGALSYPYDPSWDANTKDLFAWWMDTAADDFKRTVPKALEYGGAMAGSADLEVMGEAIKTLLTSSAGHELPGVVAQELAIWYYALGKIARLISDYRHGQAGKPDTWFDLAIYAMMARRLQSVGRWP